MTSASSSSLLYWVRLAADFTSCNCERDFTIQFDGQTDSVKAHKAFLQIRWKDYPKLLQLVNEKAVNNVVTLIDDLVAFRRLFEYFYTADFPDRSSYTDDEMDNIVNLGSLYCPEEMSDVKEKLVNQEIFCLKDAYKMLNDSTRLDLSGLKDKASEYIDKYIDGVNRNAETYFVSSDFLELEKSCLINLLQSDDLSCEEVNLFEAVVRWGKNKQDSFPSSDKLRDILGDSLYQIRYPLMTSLEVTTIVSSSGLLLVEEMANLFVFFCSDEATRARIRNKLPFNFEPRAPVISQQAYFVLKSESPIPSSSHSTPPLEESDDDSTSSRDTLFTPNRNSLEINLQAYDLDADTWGEIMAKVEAGEIPKNTTELKCTVNTDYRTRGESEVPPISLPHLEKIMLDLHTPVQRNETNPILRLRKVFNVDEHLFFKKDKGDDVNIEIIVNGCSFLKWTPAQQREVIIGVGEPHSEPFLERLKDEKVMERFNKLTIVGNKLANVMSDNNSSNSVRTFPGSTVKDVMLWGVEDESSLLLGDFLRSFVNLECLHCWTKGPLKEENEREENSPAREISMIDIHRDLTSADKLVKLSISEAALVVHPEDNIASIVKANVTEFYSHNCHFSPEIYANFDRIFPKLRKVSFAYDGFTVKKKFLLGQGNDNRSKRRKISAKEKTVTLMNSQTVQLVNNILKIKDIEMIRIAYLEWDLVPENIVAERNVKAFLKRAGWPARKQDKDVRPYDFLVTKNATTGKWKFDKRINPDGRCADEKSTKYNRYWNCMDKSVYEFFMLDRIFKDFRTFQK